MGSYFQTYNWHLEVSSKCPLSCPQCLRVLEPDTFRPKEMSLDFIQRNFTPSFLRDNVLRMTFSGGYGDAIYHSHLAEVIKYLKTSHSNYQQVIVTNGSHRKAEWWEELCSVLNSNDEIIFSIDGWDQESNSQYRKGCDWKTIETAIDVATKSKALTRWSTILFRFNQDKLDHIRELARKKGVDSFHYVFPDRFEGDEENPLKPDDRFVASITRTQRHKVKLQGKNTKFKLSRPIFDQIDQIEESIRAKNTKLYKDSPIMPTCNFGYRGAYIDVEGYYSPCSWISHPFPKLFSELDPSKVQTFEESYGKYLPRVNLNERTLSEVLSDSMWQDFQAQWASIKEAPIMCEKKCLNKGAFLQTRTVEGSPEK